MDLSLVEPAEDKTGKRVRCGECQGCMGEPASELLRDHNPTCAPIWGPSPGTAD